MSQWGGVLGAFLVMELAVLQPAPHPSCKVGEILRRNEDMSEAADAFEECARYHPRSLGPLLNLGMALLAAGKSR